MMRQFKFYTMKKLVFLAMLFIANLAIAQQQDLDFGTGTDGDGETVKSGFTKIQANFDDLYGRSVYLKDYGAVGDGTTNDSADFATALATGKNIDLEPGKTYAISTLTTLTLAQDGQVLNGNGATLLFPNKWDNKAALEITGDNVTVKNLNIIENSASAIDSDKNETENVGIGVKGVNAKIENVKVEGFCFPLAARNAVADGLTIDKSEFSLGFAWVEFDSARNVTVLNSKAYSNGYDGWKLQNEFERTMDGFKMDNCEAYNNGLRDTAAGGSETGNGNGIDMYNGGNETFISNCRFYGNYGSGVNIKGETIDGQKQSNIYFVNVQSENNINTTAGQAAGFEINTNSSTASSLIHFTNCLANNNPGIGWFIMGGYGITLNSCDVMSNTLGGISITKYSKDISINQCNIFANGGDTGGSLRIGNTDSGTYIPARIRITNSVFSGNYDYDTAAEFDPRNASGTVISETAIRVYSDSGDVVIEGNSFYNFANQYGTIWSNGKQVFIEKNYIYNANSAGISVYGGDATINNNHIQETDFSTYTDKGSIYVPAGTAYIGRNRFTQASNVGGSFAIQSFSSTGNYHQNQDLTNITKVYAGSPLFQEYNDYGLVVDIIGISSSRNISAADVLNTVSCTAASTLTITASFSAMAVGDIINLEALGAALTITGATGVTVNGDSEGSVVIDGTGTYTGGILRKTATNTYIVL